MDVCWLVTFIAVEVEAKGLIDDVGVQRNVRHL